MKARYALIAAAGLLASVSYANAGNEGGKRGPDMERMAILLDLDDSQKVEVERILKEQHEARRAARDEARQAETRPTREQMHAQRAAHKQETMGKLQTVLTPEQIKKFEALMDRPMRGHKHRRD